MKRYIYEGMGFDSHERPRIIRPNNDRILCIDTERLTVEVVPEPRMVCQFTSNQKCGPWHDYQTYRTAEQWMEWHKSGEDIDNRGPFHHARIVEKIGDEILRVVETWSPPEVTYTVEYNVTGKWEPFTCPIGREQADRILDRRVEVRPDIRRRIIDSTGRVVREYEPPAPKPERWRVERLWPVWIGRWDKDKSDRLRTAESFAKEEGKDHIVRRESDNRIIATFRWVPGRVEEERHE